MATSTHVRNRLCITSAVPSYGVVGVGALLAVIEVAVTVPSEPVVPRTTTLSPSWSAESVLGCEVEIVELGVVDTFTVLP